MEILEFEINLHGTGWDEIYPECAVYVNDDMKWRGIVAENKSIKFKNELDDEQECELKIQYLNRNADLDVVRDQNQNIIRNRQIDIVDISVDDIELDYYSILYSLSQTSFTDYHYAQLNKKHPEKYPLTINNNTLLGTECYWTLKFTTPFYIWLLENL